MSAKWRALQHRHQWTYNAIVFPGYYIETLKLLPPDVSGLKFFVELKELVSLNSLYSQMSSLKKVASAFGALLSNGDESVVSAMHFYLEILFLENSLPFHRTLISVLSKNQSVAEYRDVIDNCFQLLCKEYGVSGSKGKKFSLARVALSLINFPKIGFLIETVGKCLIPIALNIWHGLQSVLSEIDEGSRPSPIIMEHCQEALSCLYYLLQRFPTEFTNSKAEYQSVNCLVSEDSTVFEIVVKSILDVLKSSAFSRDCLVAAGVSFCAALQACMNPCTLACFIAHGFFCQPGYKYSIVDTDETLDINESGLLNLSLKIFCNGNFSSVIKAFSVLSRLCLLRGMLTAIPRTTLNTHFIVSVDIFEFNELSNGRSGFDLPGLKGRAVWTILFDGILPELCNYCENPINSHFNFHALTVTQICLQQIKTSMSANLIDQSGIVLREALQLHGLAEEYYYNPFPESMLTRVLRIIWDNLEDHLNQTVKQVHLIFDLFLDIQSMLIKSRKQDELVESVEKTKNFLCKLALDLLSLGGRCKGRYVPLSSLTKRLGAKTILVMNPNLLFETTHAYIDDDVCCSATSFLKCFLECLRDEYWSSDGIEKGYSVFRELCLPPILLGLVSGLPKLRTNLNTYALPVVLEMDAESIFPMFSFISAGQSGAESKIKMDFPEIAAVLPMALTVDQCVASLVSLLKVSRSLALIEGDIDWYCDSYMPQEKNGLHNQSLDRFALVYVKGIEVKFPVQWLVLALTHVDDTLRIDAAELLFLNPKTSSLPSPLELSLMKEAVPLNMRCCSTAFQMKWTSLFRKFFSRVRTVLDRQAKQGSGGNKSPTTTPDLTVTTLDFNQKKMVDPRVDDLFHFMKWLSCFLFFSCYPSAPYERKTMAMELLLTMINVWPVSPITPPAMYLCPYSEGFTSPDSTLLLVGSIIDSWDRLRENSFRILLHFPTPLPGILDEEGVKELITWAKRLVCSPRVRESDAGALTLRLIFRKYVLELGWTVGASVNVTCFKDPQACKSRSPVGEYVLSLVDWLRVAVEKGEQDLSEVCEKSFVHGVLLTLRYTFEDLEWNSEVIVASGFEMRDALEKLLELVMRITSLALWVVSADAWCLPEGTDDMVEDDMFLSDEPVEIDTLGLSSEPEKKNLELVETVRPAEQVVMVGCWLAMKEVSLLLGTIIRKIPLPGYSPSNSSNLGNGLGVVVDKEQTTMHNAMLDLKQLETIGNHFLQVLLKMKHNGAIDKTRAGFTALCNRLLCSNDPRLCRMTESWMEQLMERTVAKGQTVDDLLRRSAGIPAAFIAFFLSEPEGTPKKLLPWALRWLIDVAKMSSPSQVEAHSPNGKASTASLFATLAKDVDGNEKVSKIRDEGVIPTVHAFNVLRAAFNDTNIATDTSGFSAEALIISIRSFSSPYWEVRNSACLAYTSLVRRMIGFLNVHKRDSTRRALTGLEFFHRYPTLHQFLFVELKIATELLWDVSSENSEPNMQNNVHPSLCPMLILLSRLKPSVIGSETQDPLDPFLFMSFIRRCATQRNLRVRVLASRALTGLVSNEKLQPVLQTIASGLPHERNKMKLPESVGLISSSYSISIGAVNDKCCFVSFNSIHGVLLQLSSLLDINCRNLTDISRKDQILGELILVLARSAWIGSIKLCPCPTLNGSYLQVLGHMLSIARTCTIKKHVAIQSLILKLSSECLDSRANFGLEFYDPTKMELHRQATRFYFDCVFGGSTEASDDCFLINTRASSLPSSNLLEVPEIRSFDRFQERLMSCLSDALYEVRLATLKWLWMYLKSTKSNANDNQTGNGFYSIDLWAKTNLQRTLLRLLDVEQNTKCSYYILRILFSWNLLQFSKVNDLNCDETIEVGGMDRDSVFHFWDKLISMKRVARHTKTRETIIRCMGICIKRLTRLFMCLVCRDCPREASKAVIDSTGRDYSGKWVDIYGCINLFVIQVKQNSASSEPVNMRRAAAEALVASGLLEQAVSISSLVSNEQILSDEPCGCEVGSGGFDLERSKAIDLFARDVLELWFTCVKLLEDEDVSVRQGLAMDVQRFIYSSGSASIQNGASPTQVERVIKLSFEFLSSIFGHWLVYLDYLSGWVNGSAISVITGQDLVRRVFDKEIDNHHEERLLICQICCFHLEKLLSMKPWEVGLSKERCKERLHLGTCRGVGSFLDKWRMRFLQQILSFADSYLRTEGVLNWIGGIGNHKDTFISLYANLLGLYAFSQCPVDDYSSLTETENHLPLLTGLVELGKLVRPFLKNPLISNLYLLVLQSHEKMFGVRLGCVNRPRPGDGSVWKGFNPYFLLR